MSVSINERVPIIVNSANRSSGIETNFVYNIKKSIKRIQHIEIGYLEIPFSYYVFNNNNTLITGGVASTAVISLNSYTADELVLELQTQLGGGFVVIYNNITKLLNISNTVAFTIDPTSTSLRMLGFTNDTSNALLATSHTSDTITNLSLSDNNLTFFSNNIFITIGAGGSITITPGNYTVNSLIVEINNLLPGFTLSFNSATYKFSLTGPTPYSIDNNSTSLKYLGFTNIIDNSITKITHIASSVLNISGSNYLNIKSKFLTDSFINKTISSKNATSHDAVLCSVPINTPPGSIIISNPNTILKLGFRKSINPSDNIDFSIEDDQGNPVDINGIDWSMHLFAILV
jgi:hypothetical protein